MKKPLVTMKIEVLEADAVISFIQKVDIDALSTSDLEKLNEALDKKRLETGMKLYKRRKAGGDFNTTNDRMVISKKIRKEAKRYQVDIDDLADAVSVMQYERKGMTFNAKEYRYNIKKNTENLWIAAKRVVEFIDQYK